MRRLAFALALALFVCLPLAAQPLRQGAATPLSVTRGGVAGAHATVSAMASNGASFLVLWWDDRATLPVYGTNYGAGWAMRFGADGTPLDELPIALPFYPGGAVWAGGEWVIAGGGMVARMSADGVLLETKATRPAFGGEGIAWTGDGFVLASSRSNEKLQALTLDASLNVVREEVLLDARGQILGISGDGQSAVIAFIGDNMNGPRELQAASFGRDGLLQKRATIAVPSPIEVYGGNLGATGLGYVFVTSPRAVTGIEAIWIGRDLSARRIGTVYRGDMSALSTAPQLVWDGVYLTHYWALTTHNPYSNRLLATRFTAEGFLLSTETLTDWTQLAPRLHAAAANGVTLLSSAQIHYAPDEQPRVHLRAFTTPAGFQSAADTTPLEHGTFSQETPSGASSATQSLVAWRERPATTGSRPVYATRLDAEGRVLDPQSLLLGTSCSDFPPAVASNGREFLVAWYGESDVRVANVRSDATFTMKRALLALSSPCGEAHLGIASNGTDYLLVWAASDETHRDVWRLLGLRVAADGTPLDDAPFVIARSLSGAVVTTIASDGRDYLVAWHNRAVRVTREGVPLDRDNHITLGAGGIGRLWWNGSHYVAVTHDFAALRVLRIGSDGSGGRSPFGPQADPTPVPPSFHWIGTGFGVVDEWGYALPVTQRLEDGSRRISIVRFDDDGTNITVRVQPIGNVRYTFGDPDGPRSGLLNAGRMVLITHEQRQEKPYSGVHRLFASPVAPARSRAVRH